MSSKTTPEEPTRLTPVHPDAMVCESDGTYVRYDDYAKLRALVQEHRKKLDIAVKHAGSAVLLLNDDKATREWKKVLKKLRSGLAPTNTNDNG